MLEREKWPPVSQPIALQPLKYRRIHVPGFNSPERLWTMRSIVPIAGAARAPIAVVRTPAVVTPIAAMAVIAFLAPAVAAWTPIAFSVGRAPSIGAAISRMPAIVITAGFQNWRLCMCARNALRARWVCVSGGRRRQNGKREQTRSSVTVLHDRKPYCWPFRGRYNIIKN